MPALRLSTIQRRGTEYRFPVASDQFPEGAQTIAPWSGGDVGRDTKYAARSTHYELRSTDGAASL